MLSPQGKVVLISGANRGIGLAIARNLYDAGYTLSLGVRDLSSLEVVTQGWDSTRFHKARYDAEHQDTHQRWIDSTLARFERIDALVNNAGIALSVQVEDDNDADLDRLWAVNVKAPLSMIRKALPHLRKSGHGRIINLASIAGKAVFDAGVGYSLSKFALVALSHATRHAGWKDGVRCTAFCPGYVSTDMTSKVQTLEQDKMTNPNDIAELVATIIGLSNNASVAELIVNCRNDVSM